MGKDLESKVGSTTRRVMAASRMLLDEDMQIGHAGGWNAGDSAINLAGTASYTSAANIVKK